jgi:hypothetical protein
MGHIQRMLDGKWETRCWHREVEHDLAAIVAFTCVHYVSQDVFYAFHWEGATRRVYPW